MDAAPSWGGQGWKDPCLSSSPEKLMSQGLLGLCCSIETRDRVEIITITAVLFE